MSDTMTLEDICLDSLAVAVCSLPPTLKEMVTEKAEEKIRSELENQMSEILENMIPAIVKCLDENPEKTTEDFYRQYPDTPRALVSSALNIACSILDTMNEKRRYSISYYNITIDDFDE